MDDFKNRWVWGGALCVLIVVVVSVVYARKHTPASEVAPIPPTEKGTVTTLRGLLDSGAVQNCTFLQGLRGVCPYRCGVYG